MKNKMKYGKNMQKFKLKIKNMMKWIYIKDVWKKLYDKLIRKK